MCGSILVGQCLGEFAVPVVDEQLDEREQVEFARVLQLLYRLGYAAQAQ
jgi:hypothetical protein